MNKNLFLTDTGKIFTPELIPVIFLHGFSGSAEDWQELIKNLPNKFFPVVYNLPGHGNNIPPFDNHNYSQLGLIKQLVEIYDFFKFNKAVLVGYSMGGRAALTFAVNMPGMVSGLFLESSTAGLKSAADRADRIAADEKLAEFILTHSIKEFTEYWMELPLFDSQKKLAPEVVNMIRETKLYCNKEGLAASLRGFGTGQMPPLWDEIKYLSFPVRLISGELDEKFTKINMEMNNLFPFSEHTIIKNCGHNTHLENPGEFLRVLLLFLNQF